MTRKVISVGSSNLVPAPLVKDGRVGVEEVLLKNVGDRPLDLLKLGLIFGFSGVIARGSDQLFEPVVFLIILRFCEISVAPTVPTCDPM